MIMKKILAVLIFSFIVAGCVAHVTPEGTYLGPLPLSIVLGPPIIVEPPHHMALRPLPPIVVEPERRISFYNNLYYYYWDNLWYYGERERGPWHKLPKRILSQAIQGKGQRSGAKTEGRRLQT